MTETKINIIARAALILLTISNATSLAQTTVPVTLNSPGLPVVWDTGTIIGLNMAGLRTLDVNAACQRAVEMASAASSANGCGGSYVGVGRIFVNGWENLTSPILNTYTAGCNAALGSPACISLYGGNQIVEYATVGGAHYMLVDKYSRPPTRSCPAIGKPIHPVMGNEVHEEPLGLSIAGQSATLTYDSLNLQPSTSAADTAGEIPIFGQFGKKWWSSFDRRLVFANGRSLQAVRGRGTTVSFLSTGLGSTGGTWTPQSDQVDTLTQTAWQIPGDWGSVSYFYADQFGLSLEKYNSTGQLQILSKASGLFLVPSYSTSATPALIAPGAGYLISLADPFGRHLNFSYSTLGNGDIVINKITDPLNQDIIISYDAFGNMIDIQWPDGSARAFVYDSVFQDQASALTGIVDENNKRYATIGYDSGGRAVSTERSGAVDKYIVNYGTPPEQVITNVIDFSTSTVTRYHEWTNPIGTTISYPNGALIGLATQSILVRDPVNAPNLGSPRLAGVSQPAGSGCGASSSSITYDTNGNRTSDDDFNGSRSCYVSDLSRNLETVRVEGLRGGTVCSTVVAANTPLPTGSRKLSTQWHPEWRLETRQARPGMLVTNVYNGQPDPFSGNAIASCAPSSALLPNGKPIVVLCKRVEQATSDSDGHQGFAAMPQPSVPTRQNTWTYNQYGQILTANGPRTDVNDSTTYSYYVDTTADHTAGDLQVVTNALGAAITYDRYNKLGQVLQSTEANGVVTTNVFDQRYRLISTTTAGETTSYSYDLVGQPSTVTLPDGSVQRYVYDDAHRLIQVTDTAGNKVVYTLDPSGNRIAEQVLDATGALVKNITRSFDALNRLQGVTGAPQ